SHRERDVVVRDPHQLADLGLPVLPEPEGDGEQDDRADDEGEPSPAPWLPGFPVGEGAPDGGGPHAQSVADGCGNAADDALDKATAREQRRREGKAREDDRAPAAGQREMQQFPGLPGFGGWWWRLGRSYGQGGAVGGGSVGGCGWLTGAARVG